MSMQIETAEYFTPRELAARFKLSVRTVQYLLERGEIAGIRIGHSYRISAEDLARFESSNRTVRVPADELARYERENATGRGQ